MYFKIQRFYTWRQDSKAFKGKKHLYETEAAFKRYWKQHKRDESRYVNLSDWRTSGIIAYQDGVEIGRYGRFENVIVDVEPVIKSN